MAFYFWWQTHVSGRPDRPMVTDWHPEQDAMLAYTGNYRVVATADAPDNPDALAALNSAVVENSEGWLQFA